MDEFNKEMFQEYVGIGVVLKKDKKDLVISDVYPDSPAFHQFLQPKDVILEIGGRSSTGMSLQAAVKSLTEPQSKDATLKVVNPATKETRSLKIQKKHIAVPTVYSFCLSDPEGSFPKIYCIKIVQFNNSTAQEYQKTVVEVEKEGMDGLIIDLRSNKGGVLSEALEIANLYSKKGVMLISQPRFGPAIYYTADKNNMDRLYPIIILVNSLTASSAEVLADILRNSASGQALLVGQNSFGKNCVQRIISLEEDTSLLKFTYAQYRLPYRNQISQSKDTVADSLDRKGLRPDVYVNLFPHENEKINDFYRLSHLYKYSSNSNKGISLYELHAIDPQMTIGYYLLSLLVR
jgi:carboxyl-terminal processing protease